MVTIPPPVWFDPTLDAMKAIIAAEKNAEPRRDYVGASTIGRPCARAIWYDFNQYPRKPFKADAALRFEDGHRTEALTAERLRLVPSIELWTIDETTGRQIGFSELGGKWRGHADGVVRGLLQAPKNPHVWEAKCVGYKEFEEFRRLLERRGEKETLKAWNETYFAQAQILMKYLKLDRHYTTVALAGGRDYLSCRTEYDRAVAERYVERAEKIINAKAPPPRISDKPDFWQCRWCSFAEICHAKTA